MDQITQDIVVKTASRFLSEVFKSALSGIADGVSWASSKTKEYDVLGKAADQYSSYVVRKYGEIKVYGMEKPISLSGQFVHVHVLDKVESRASVEETDFEEYFDKVDRELSIIKERDVYASKIAAREKRLLVLGGPGSGKTTLLKHLALEAAKGNVKNNIVPALIYLKEFSGENPDLEIMMAEEFKHCGLNDEDSLHFSRRLLEQGNVIILLDGLDEVEEGLEHKIAREINRISDKYPECNIVITCRISAFEYNFEQFTEIQIAPFSEQQIESFISKWFANIDLSKVGDVCFTELKSRSSVRDLAKTPLLLTLLCLKYSQTLSFSSNRAELYEDGLHALLKKWDSTREVKRKTAYDELTAKRKETLFAIAAWETFVEEKIYFKRRLIENIIVEYVQNIPGCEDLNREVEGAVILTEIQANHGIIVERGRNIFTFSHLTFHEYFVARYLSTKSIETIGKAVRKNMTSHRWHEVYVILAELLDDASQLVSLLHEECTLKLSENIKSILEEIRSQSLKENDQIPIYYVEIILQYLYFSKGTLTIDGEIRSSILSSELYELAGLIRDLIRKGKAPYLAPPGGTNVLNATMANHLRRLKANLADISLTKEDVSSYSKYIAGRKLLMECMASKAYVDSRIRERVYYAV